MLQGESRERQKRREPFMGDGSNGLQERSLINYQISAIHSIGRTIIRQVSCRHDPLKGSGYPLSLIQIRTIRLPRKISMRRY